MSARDYAKLHAEYARCENPVEACKLFNEEVVIEIGDFNADIHRISNFKGSIVIWFNGVAIFLHDTGTVTINPHNNQVLERGDGTYKISKKRLSRKK